MNGNKFLLDTNAIIALLTGHHTLDEMLKDADWIGVSVISVIEFFSFPDLSLKDRLLFTNFIKRIEVIELTGSDLPLLEVLGNYKIEYKLKLPDAVIAGSAINLKAILISNDTDFSRIKQLSVLTF